MLQISPWEPLSQDDLQHSSLEMLQVNVKVLQVKADLQHFPASSRSTLPNVLQINPSECPALLPLLQVADVLLQWMGLLLQIKAHLQRLPSGMLHIFVRRTLRNRVCRPIPEARLLGILDLLQVTGDLLQVD